MGQGAEERGGRFPQGLPSPGLTGRGMQGPPQELPWAPPTSFPPPLKVLWE